MKGVQKDSPRQSPNVFPDNTKLNWTKKRK